MQKITQNEKINLENWQILRRTANNKELRGKCHLKKKLKVSNKCKKSVKKCENFGESRKKYAGKQKGVLKKIEKKSAQKCAL